MHNSEIPRKLWFPSGPLLAPTTPPVTYHVGDWASPHEHSHLKDILIQSQYQGQSINCQLYSHVLKNHLCRIPSPTPSYAVPTLVRSCIPYINKVVCYCTSYKAFIRYHSRCQSDLRPLLPRLPHHPRPSGRIPLFAKHF